MDQQIFAKVDEYISNLFGGHDEDLANAELAIIESKIPQISISPNQGKFLHILTRIIRPKRILEIGTLGGYSTIWFAKAMPVGGKIVTLELDPQHAALAQSNFDRAGLKDSIDIRIGKAIDLLPTLLTEGKGPFDLIFIDADKSPYREYFQWALKLSKKGTVIIADNVIREGKVIDPESKDEMVNGAQKFNSFLASTPGVTATIFQTVGSKEHDGMAIAIVD